MIVFEMSNILQKAIYYFGKKSMSERTDRNNSGFFESRIFADHCTRYNFAASFVKNKTVLDIACGEGFGTMILSRKAKEITGVDISVNTIIDARKKYNTSNYPSIRFISSEALIFLKKTRKKFDVIVCYETIEHIKEYKIFLTLINKRLKSEGLLILSTPNKKFSDLLAGDTFNPFHVKEFYCEELTNIVTEIFGQIPQVYFQRPVQNNRVLRSFFEAFILQKSSRMIRESAGFTGIDLIFITRNKS